MDTTTYAFFKLHIDAIEKQMKDLEKHMKVIDSPDHTANNSALCALKRVDMHYATLLKELRIAAQEVQ
jgi:hypothetical protein